MKYKYQINIGLEYKHIAYVLAEDHHVKQLMEDILYLPGGSPTAQIELRID